MCPVHEHLACTELVALFNEHLYELRLIELCRDYYVLLFLYVNTALCYKSSIFSESCLIHFISPYIFFKTSLTNSHTRAVEGIDRRSSVVCMS